MFSSRELRYGLTARGVAHDRLIQNGGPQDGNSPHSRAFFPYIPYCVLQMCHSSNFSIDCCGPQLWFANLTAAVLASAVPTAERNMATADCANLKLFCAHIFCRRFPVTNLCTTNQVSFHVSVTNIKKYL
ncbi:hypothetical protein J6590_063682 [Homalodisca vitripennis]|nr:hypothetical protein J6590_063682 [Homalodisca vitripennis]